MQRLASRLAPPIVASLAMLTACSVPIRLHAPSMSATLAREDTAKVDLEPMTSRERAVVSRSSAGERIAPKPDAAAVLTAGMRSELAARALRGGERGGYVVRCALERFAMRDESSLLGAKRFATLYVDASCEVQRAADKAVAWRGELRGRTCTASGASPLSRDQGILQVLIDRMTSDVAREMASDLAVRVLGLEGRPSERAFQSEDERASISGIDDGPWGPVALGKRVTPADLARGLTDESSGTRAAAWNAVAMAAGPGEPWTMENPIALDDDEVVRFYQYKALARQASPETLAQLRTASGREADELLGELVRDALASGGVGVARPAKNASAVTNGATTSP